MRKIFKHTYLCLAALLVIIIVTDIAFVININNLPLQKGMLCAVVLLAVHYLYGKLVAITI